LAKTVGDADQGHDEKKENVSEGKKEKGPYSAVQKREGKPIERFWTTAHAVHHEERVRKGKREGGTKKGVRDFFTPKK